MSSQYPLDKPAAPSGIYPEPKVLGGPDVLREEYVTQNGYSYSQVVILSSLTDEVEREVGPETFARMSKDPIIHKSKRIRINGVLTDDFIFAAGRTEEEVGPTEYKRYMEVMQFAERIVGGLEHPYWRTLEMLLGGGYEQGHKIGEVVREYRLDRPTKPVSTETKQRGAKPASSSPIRSLISRAFGKRQAQTEEEKQAQEPKRRGTSIMSQPKIRLMPRYIKVKPRGAVLFVVDEYMNVLGLVPAYVNSKINNWTTQNVITRDKFIVFVNNPEDDDPRGTSAWRPAFTWWNFVMHVPKEYLRFLLQEAMPIPVLELPEGMEKWMAKRGPDGEILYEDPETRKYPIMLEATESAKLTLENIRNGKAIAIPPKSKLTPYVGKGTNGDTVFPNAISTAYRLVEDSIVNQSLAQSEGEHQARAASITHEGRLNDVFFWDKRAIAFMTLYDLIAVDVKNNLGDWALPYMPKLSLGDSEKRDWAKDLETIAKSYFYGFIDDTQRAELMAWLSLPKPGPSRAEVLAQQDPTTGEPVMPQKNRPDKQPGNDKRNDGNSKDPNQGQNAETTDRQEVLLALGDVYTRYSHAQHTESRLFAVGHHSRRRNDFVSYLPGGPR
jgi:hypothetical protein